MVQPGALKDMFTEVERELTATTDKSNLKKIQSGGRGEAKRCQNFQTSKLTMSLQWLTAQYGRASSAMLMCSF